MTKLRNNQKNFFFKHFAQFLFVFRRVFFYMKNLQKKKNKFFLASYKLKAIINRLHLTHFRFIKPLSSDGKSYPKTWLNLYYFIRSVKREWIRLFFQFHEDNLRCFNCMTFISYKIDLYLGDIRKITNIKISL